MKERYEKITYLTKEIVFLEFVLILSIPVAFAFQEYSLTYDGNGNLILGDGKFRVYNDFNQLIEVYSGNDTSGEVLEFYLWHPTEDRILMKKVFNGSVYPEEVVVYVNDNFDKSYTNLGGDPFINETYYVYDDYGLVGEEIYNTTFRGVDDQPVYPATFLQKIFYHSDHLGSTTVITNSSGGIVEKTFYDPYGEIISGGEIGRYQYEGKEFSSVTGDYDFNFRKYDPELGIFTQPDAVLVNVYDPQQLNRYSFEMRNPYIYKDENGKWAVGADAGGGFTYTPALVGGTGSVGVVLSRSKSYGIQIGLSFSSSAGISFGGIGKVFISGSLSPSAKHLGDVEGESDISGIAGAYGPYAGGASVSRGELGPTYAISYNPGLGAEFYNHISTTRVLPLIQFSSRGIRFGNQIDEFNTPDLTQQYPKSYHNINFVSGCPAYSSCSFSTQNSGGNGGSSSRNNRIDPIPYYDPDPGICRNVNMCYGS